MQFSRVSDEIAYFRPGPFYNTEPGTDNPWDSNRFKAFVDKSFKDLQVNPAQTLIIDLRNNPGGTNSFSDHLVKQVADRPFSFSSDFRVRISRASIEANEQRLALDSVDSINQ